MLKRHFLSAFVLFSFINVCAYGGGWFDFFLPRSNPDTALEAIAQRWMQERRDLGVGTSGGTACEGVHNPSEHPDLMADFEHLRRLIGWNALFQEVNGLMEMDLDDEDIPRRAILIQELINTFCTRLGCGSFNGQHARAAALERELLNLLRSGSFNWPSLQANVTRLIEVYERHIKQGAHSHPIGYWSCIIRLLSQEYLIPLIEELEIPDGEAMNVHGAIGRNFAAQMLQYVHGLFQGNQVFRNYNEDLGSWEWRGRLENLMRRQRPIVFAIRRALALDGIEEQEAVLANSNEAVNVVADKGDEASKDEDDQPDEEKKDYKEKKEEQPNEEAEVIDEEVLALNAADAYIAWRALELELEGIFTEGGADLDALAQRVTHDWGLTGEGLPEAVRLQIEAILAQAGVSELLFENWAALRQQIQELQECLLPLFLTLLEEPIERLELIAHWTETIINPATRALWKPREEILERLLLLNRHAQLLRAVLTFLEENALFNLLEFSVQQRAVSAQRHLRDGTFLTQNRQRALPLVLQEVENNQIMAVREIIGGEGRFCEEIFPPEMWLRILEELFRSGNVSDIINFISTSLYLHGMALCPRYERVYGDDGEYEEVRSTRNVFTAFGHRCIRLGRYEEAFCYFAYMGCLGLLLDDNFSGLLEVVWQMNNMDVGRRIRLDDLLQIQRIPGAQNQWPVCQALTLQGYPIAGLEHRMHARATLLQRMLDLMQNAQVAHDTVVNPVLAIELRTVALTRLQALLRYQRDENIPVAQVWQIHEIAFTAGFSFDQVQGVIDVLKQLCLSRMNSKKKIDINMVHSILTDLIHIAGSMGPVPIEEDRRVYALQALRDIIEVLPVRYFAAYRKHFTRIQSSAHFMEVLFAEEGSIYPLIEEILTLMNERRHNPQIIEAIDDNDEL